MLKKEKTAQGSGCYCAFSEKPLKANSWWTLCICFAIYIYGFDWTFSKSNSTCL